MVLWMVATAVARAESVDAEILKDLDFFVTMDALETVESGILLEESQEAK